MYEIKLNDTVIHENSADSLKRLSAGVLAEDINQIPSFSFTIPPMNPLFSQELHDRTDTVTVTNTLTNEVEFEGHLLSSSSAMGADGKLCKKAVAEGHLGYLCDSIQMYHNYENTTPADFLTALLTAHNAQVTADGHPEKTISLGLVDIQGNTNSKTTAYRTTLEEIQVNLIERLGGEIQIRRVNGGLVLDYVQRIGVTCSTKIELAKNMKSLSVENDTSGVVTRLIPLGYQPNPGDSAERLTISSVNDGKPYLDDVNGIAQYGIIAGTAIFDDITQPTDLKTAGQNYLANNNRVRRAYECQALDLSLLDTSEQAIRCGNSYTFVNSYMGINEELRLIGRTVDIYKPYVPTLRIGDKSAHITDIATRTARLIEYEMPKQKKDILAAASARMTAMITNATKGYIYVDEEQGELLIMDTPSKTTAQKIWRWNSSGFAYSNHGYNEGYFVGLTADGKILAESVTAGSFTITGGSINITTNNGSQDVIQLIYANSSVVISPGHVRAISSHNSETVIMHGNGIDFYSFFEPGGSSNTRTISISSEHGTMSLDDLYFAKESGGTRYSLASIINNIISRLENLEGS